LTARGGAAMSDLIWLSEAQMRWIGRLFASLFAFGFF
jgi:hypothetical protein